MSTTVLPSLPAIGGCVTQQVLRTIYQEDNVSNNKYKYTTKIKWKDKKNIQSENLKSDCKGDAVADVTRHRNSFFHNLCSNTLKEGFHLAFRELFNLVKQTQELYANDESFRQSSTLPLAEHEEKLTYLQEMLVKGEIAKRQGRSEQVYEAQYALAKYFDEHEDYILADHFHLSAFTTSRQIRTDGGRKEAEANCNLGKVAERKKQFLKAIHLYEQFYFLSKDKSWKTPDGVLLHSNACYQLQNAHVSYSEQLPSEQKEQVLENLHRAHELAKEGGDEKEIGQIGYLIGNKYDFYGDQETAVKYHKEYFELCETINNGIGMGKASQALAIANRRQGNFEKAVEYLKQFLKVAEQSGDKESQREACSDLGVVYNCMGKYEQSANYYKRSFELAEDKKQPSQLNQSGCEYAIALAHGLFTGEADNIQRNSKNALESLLHWKSERLQSFSNDQRTFSMFESLEERKEEERRLQERRKSKQLENKVLSKVAQRENSVEEEATAGTEVDNDANDK